MGGHGVRYHGRPRAAHVDGRFRAEPGPSELTWSGGGRPKYKPRSGSQSALTAATRTSTLVENASMPALRGSLRRGAQLLSDGRLTARRAHEPRWPDGRRVRVRLGAALGSG
ncbi:hypothetical protein DB30_08110 [Enhygromyxa salina]|uniref:Uncharacterized protein n=1 Tax=Enhygromyxa salina TaxID=215803 RepID=A0A0C1ZQU8_9BACT|nr:hypothetical protein DB30_08110 [Enhygromyxa salina]